ncbi:MAG: methyltransferase domain-containing protein [Flavobacteriales bacterium]|nr:methyltransferase domain-containing protein [Flavobacteriales bacterium]
MFRFFLNTLPRPLLIRLSYIFRLVAPFLYRGKEVECSVCKNSFSKFLPYGSKVALRENVLCPHCLSLERHRLLWLYLNQKTNFFTDSLDVMHIAPEQCFHGRFKRLKNINYYTGDLVSPLAEYHFDLHDIPFEENKFDVVICNHVMEHVDDDLQCMRELFRILKPGGWAIMQVPIDYSRKETYEDSSIVSPEDRETHFWQKDHVRLYGRDYGKRLAKAGFTVKEDGFVQEIDPTLRERLRLQEEEIIFFLTKEKGTQ